MVMMISKVMTMRLQYKVQGEMGRGKFGTVYHVVGRKDGISYASKHVKYRYAHCMPTSCPAKNPVLFHLDMSSTGTASQKSQRCQAKDSLDSHIHLLDLFAILDLFNWLHFFNPSIFIL